MQLLIITALFILLIISNAFASENINISAINPEAVSLESIAKKYISVAKDIKLNKAADFSGKWPLQVKYKEIIVPQTKERLALVFEEGAGLCGAHYCPLYVYHISAKPILIKRFVSPQIIHSASCGQSFYLFWEDTHQIVVNQISHKGFSPSKYLTEDDLDNLCYKEIYYTIYMD